MIKLATLAKPQNVTGHVKQLLNHLIMLHKDRQITIITLVGLFLLQSCDPVRVLVIRTANRPNYSVTIYANENILPHSFPYHQDSIAPKIVIQVPTADTVSKKEKLFMYGIGGWGDNTLMPNFSKNVDSIIIVNNKGKLILDKQPEINNYLLKHRHGFAKHILTIEAK